MQCTEISSDQVAGLVAELNSTGYCCVPDYIQPEELARMRSFVTEAVESAGYEYVGLSGPEQVAGSGLDELYYEPAFGQLMRSLYEQGTGRAAPDQEFYHVLRCLTGESVQKHSMLFHYDSYVVTALIPIHMPTEGSTGDLLIFPNTRGIRPVYMLNALDKVLLDNPVTQRALRSSVKRNVLHPVRIKMQPGHLYFFWGYRSIHTNEPCDPDKVRATALFHYGNPHRKSD